MASFADTFDRFLDAFVALEPVAATSIGDHRHDGRWPDLSARGREERLAFIARWHSAFAVAEAADAPETIDRDLVLGELEAMRFGETELREDAWDPLTWVYLFGDGIFPLLAREFAPLADRLSSVAGRLETIGEVTAAARASLVGAGPDRPVGRLQTEVAIEQLPGVVELIDEAVATAGSAAGTDPVVAALRPRLEAASIAAKADLAAFERHLNEVVLPASRGDGRLGEDLFARKMRHTMRSETLTADRIIGFGVTGVRRHPGRDDPPRPRAVASLAIRHDDARG